MAKRKEKEKCCCGGRGKGDVEVIEAVLVVLINNEDKLSEHMQTKQNTERTWRKRTEEIGMESTQKPKA